MVVVAALIVPSSCFHAAPATWSNVRPGQPIRLSAPASLWIEGASAAAAGKRCKATVVNGILDSRDGASVRLRALRSAKSLFSSDSNCVWLNGDSVRIQIPDTSAVTLERRAFSVLRTAGLGAGLFVTYFLVLIILTVTYWGID